MNRTKLKNYAPQARRDFIRAVTDRAAFYGLTPKKVEPVTEQGDVAIIGGRAFPKAVIAKRIKLEERIRRDGFEQVMEALAYTWFNRLVALRYMELHGFLEHGYRVLSNPDPAKTAPEILEHAEHVNLPGLKRDAVVDLKLAANKEGELYRMLLIAQCNALHAAMPFLFERIDDETELVLPESLLHSDSIVRQLIGEIDEEDWQEVEIIGWLYQFYISEKKDQVIGKVVKSEDIPAATQLFTPNWIVKYLVQNTLGRQWLATYPQSPLRQQMEYYIEPAEQTPEVQEQLKAITPASLNPEELTLLDPACGSGHILVEAYELFKAIYQERGYRAKDIPRLILEKNLFGLEIDDRAAQLAAFALMMKARADDRRIFDGGIQPNVLAFQESRGLDAADITHALNAPINKEDVPKEYLFEEVEEEQAGLYSKKALAEKGHVSQADIAHLLELLENAKTFGSLIQIPPKLAAKLPEIETRIDDVLKYGDLTHASAHVLKPLLRQARLLVRQYDAVVANPPYMGSKSQPGPLKAFTRTTYSDARADLFACFIQRSLSLTCSGGCTALITRHGWMFLSTYDDFRERLLSTTTVLTMAHLGGGAFSEISGEVVQTTAFVLSVPYIPEWRPTYIRLVEGDEGDKKAQLASRTADRYTTPQDSLRTIPGSPFAYWVSDQMRRCFERGTPLGHLVESQPGLQTSSNATFVRFWHEVDYSRIGFGFKSNIEARSSHRKWFPYNKGGEFRRWYGNNLNVVDWEDDGARIKTFVAARYPYLKGNIDYVVKDRGRYFRPCLTWTVISSSSFSIRVSDAGFLFDSVGSAIFPPDEWRYCVAGFLASGAASAMLAALNPTLHFQVGNVITLPFLVDELLAARPAFESIVRQAVDLARDDWDSQEMSWDFRVLPVVLADARVGSNTLARSQAIADAACNTRFDRMRHLEIENDRLVRTAYGLEDRISDEVNDGRITLYRPDREEDIKRLLSYAIGCMMGRYSLDELGLIYAHSGNQGFDASRYKTFRADEDGLVPLLETDWGVRDDATSRIVEFISVAWPKEHLEENLKFIADSLGPSKGEQPRDTIRRYLATGFYKHHLSMYKKRPIYWLFSSGKQRAFQCLVYLHRYNEGTLARMRTEYVIPLQGKFSAHIDQLAEQLQKATSTTQRRDLTKERDRLLKQQVELQTFDEKLRHYADQRIPLDLDDGVKVNYAKFGDLLAEVKAVTGGASED